MDAALDRACPACAAQALRPFFRAEQLPVHCNVFRTSADEARTVGRGDIHLAVCTDCGLVHNTAFDPAKLEYGGHYEASLHFSPHFRTWAAELADRLVSRFELKGRLAVEIGCGKGEFLATLVERGARGLGFDEGYAGEVDASAPDGLEIRRSFFDAARDADTGSLDGALVLARHVLEHVEDPSGFLDGIRPALSTSGGGVYLEVPDATFTLRDRGIWDLIYEHCSYFTPASLRRLVGSAGIQIDEMRGGEYGGQFLSVEGRWAPGAAAAPATGSDDDVDEVVALAQGFAETFREFTSSWSERLTGWLDASRRVAVWGMGSKGVTFLNLMERGDEIRTCIDLNPRKRGLFVPGTAQPIRTPDELGELAPADRPDVVLVMNPLYENEIRSSLVDLGIEAEVAPVV